MAGEWKPEYGVRSNAKRKVRRWKERGILDEGEAIVDGSAVRTITVLRNDAAIELLRGRDVARALGLGSTRLHDWTKAGAIPPAIEMTKVKTRYYTHGQVALIRKLADRNDHCANAAQLAERNALIQEIGQRWND